MAERFSKNEATDLLDNKGSGLGAIRNEATIGGRDERLTVGEEESKVGQSAKGQGRSWLFDAGPLTVRLLLMADG
jgi:hypothetical protein